jgi:cyclohexanone monooxygenase
VLLSQFHSNWLGDCFDWLKHEGRGPIEATEASETEWVNHTNEVADATLFPEANSWYMGANIPGKPRVILTYLGGFLEYRRRLAVATEAGYSGFKLGL